MQTVNGEGGEWEVMFDGESGQAYFTNRMNGETSWEVPQGMRPIQIDGQVASYVTDGEPIQDDSFVYSVIQLTYRRGKRACLSPQ
jgi:hypothetical protein